MPKDSLVYTGHYIDHELVQGIEEDCAARRARKMQNFGSHDAKNISYNLDVKANARGYEQLATMGLKSTKRLS